MTDQQDFASKLREQMDRHRLTQSGLARSLWGTDTDGSGKARGRDKISKYLRGMSLPSADTLEQLCEIFATTPEELALAMIPPAAKPPSLATVKDWHIEAKVGDLLVTLRLTDATALQAWTRWLTSRHGKRG